MALPNPTTTPLLVELIQEESSFWEIANLIPLIASLIGVLSALFIAMLGHRHYRQMREAEIERQHQARNRERFFESRARRQENLNQRTLHESTGRSSVASAYEDRKEHRRQRV